jgi:MFS family permease
MTEAAEGSPPAEAPLPPRWRAWFMVAVLMVLSAVSFLDRHVIALMVEPIRADLGVNDFQLGLLQGIAFALFYASFGIPFGWLADRTSRRWIIYVGVTIWSLAAASGALARNFTQLFLARLGVGAGEAALMPAGYSMIADMFPRRRLTTALSVFTAGLAVGAGLALAIGGHLVGYAVARGDIVVPVLGPLRSWQFVFLVTGLPGLALAFLVFLIREPVRRGVSATARPPLGPFLKSRWRMFRGHFGGFTMTMVMGFALAGWAPTYLIRHFHWKVADVGTVLGLMTVFPIVGGITMGWIVDRWFHRGRTDAHLRIYIYAAPLAAALNGLAMIMPTAVSFLLFYGLAGSLLALAAIGSGAIQVVTPNALRGQVSAVYGFTINVVGMSLGPMAVGLFTDHVFHSEAMVGWSIFCVMVIAAPIASLLFWSGCAGMRDAVARFPEAPQRAEPTPVHMGELGVSEAGG